MSGNKGKYILGYSFMAVIFASSLFFYFGWKNLTNLKNGEANHKKACEAEKTAEKICEACEAEKTAEKICKACEVKKESEFEKAYTKFERNPFLENKNASSDLAFNKELFDAVTNFGIVIVPNVIEKLRHDSSSGVAISVLSKLTKTNFEFTKDEKTHTYHYIDY